MRILVVDDNPSDLKIFSALFGSRGHAVTTCKTVEECLPQLRANAFDLVILDQNMPRMGGLELLAEIKREFKRQNVLIVTSAGTPAQAAQALQSGAVDYLIKPMTSEKLISSIEKVLSQLRLK